MKKIIAIYSCLFLICFPTMGFSQADPDPEPLKITVHLLDENLIEWEGIKYILMDENTATIFFDRFDKYPKLELKINKLSELVTLYSKQLTLNTDININLQEQNNLVIKENVGLKKIISKGDPWWKSPILWTILGVLAGAGTTIAIFKIAKEI